MPRLCISMYPLGPRLVPQGSGVLSRDSRDYIGSYKGYIKAILGKPLRGTTLAVQGLELLIIRLGNLETISETSGSEPWMHPSWEKVFFWLPALSHWFLTWSLVILARTSTVRAFRLLEEGSSSLGARALKSEPH